MNSKAIEIIAQHNKVTAEAVDRLMDAGWKLACAANEHVDPNESEVHLQVVADADEVLQYFGPNGIVKKGGLDDATVLAAISTLSWQVHEVMTPRDLGRLEAKRARER